MLHNCPLIFCIGANPPVVKAAAQRPDKSSSYKCCFPDCNGWTNQHASYNKFLKHVQNNHNTIDLPPSDLIRTEGDNFSVFEHWDHGKWIITRNDASNAIPSNSEDAMEVDGGLPPYSQPTLPCMDTDDQNKGTARLTGSVGVRDTNTNAEHNPQTPHTLLEQWIQPDQPGVDDADIHMEVETETPPIAAETVDCSHNQLGQRATDRRLSSVSGTAASQFPQVPESAPRPAEGLPEVTPPYDMDWEEGAVQINGNDTATPQDSHNLKVSELAQTGISLLICVPCQSPVNPATIDRHFRDTKGHGNWATISSQTKDWIRTLKQGRTFATKAENVPSQTTGICWPPIKGLPVQREGYQCIVCAKCFASKASCSKCTRSHEKQPPGSLTCRRVSIQQVFHKYIAVDTDLSDAGPAAQQYISLGYTSKVEALSSSAPPIDLFETPPWVQETNWLNLLGPFITNGPEKALHLVNLPFSDKKSPFTSPLRLLVEYYMKVVGDLISAKCPVVFDMRQYLQAIPMYVFFFGKYLWIHLIIHTLVRRALRLGRPSNQRLCRRMLCYYRSWYIPS